MRKLIILAISIFHISLAIAQQTAPDKEKVAQDLNDMLQSLKENYVYLDEKALDVNCLREQYSKQINDLKTQDDVVLLFETLLCEFYDSHLILNTNIHASYRLYAPIYVRLQNEKFVITNVWQSQLMKSTNEIIGSEVATINGVDVNKAILNFPTHCSNKNLPEVKEWIVNKMVAGRYDQQRILGLKLINTKTLNLNLDSLVVRKETTTLTASRKNQVGIIRINNSLGNSRLVEDFDHSLDSLMDTKVLIIDLRNTVDGGESYVARGIMSHFISQAQPYQKHSVMEKAEDGPPIERSWVEYVSPRGKTYSKPVIVLVGRWTGSMGEGLAIGLEGIQRGIIVGTEMERLAGEMQGFSFKNQRFGYRLSISKLFHVNGAPREQYVPSHYVKETSIARDEALEAALKLSDQLKK